MELPPGVTGFGSVPRGTAPTDFDRFKTACASAARRLGGRVVRAESCDGRATPNFHRAVVFLGREHIEVICNARFPFVAVIRPTEGGNTSLTFIDVPGLSDALADVGRLEVIPAQELNAPLRQEHLEQLSWAERRQAAYWKPRTVGEVMFNFWD